MHNLATLDDINFNISLVYMVTYTQSFSKNILSKKSLCLEAPRHYPDDLRRNQVTRTAESASSEYSESSFP